MYAERSQMTDLHTGWKFALVFDLDAIFSFLKNITNFLQ